MQQGLLCATHRLSAKLWLRAEVGVRTKTDEELNEAKMPALTRAHDRCQPISLGHVIQIRFALREELHLRTECTEMR